MPEGTNEQTASAKILERLSKLMAQEQGERALENYEAAARFAEKIQELLVRHKLSLSEVEAWEQNESNPFAHVMVDPPAWGERWKPRRIERIENLADVVAKAHYCRLMVLPDKNCVIFVGRKTDADVAAYVWRRLGRTAWDLCEKDRETAKKRAQRAQGGALAELIAGGRWEGNKAFRYSYYWGFTVAIYDRYKAQQTRLEIEAGECMALVRAERDIEKYMEDLGNPEAEAIDDKQRRNPHAYNIGYQRGKQVNLTADALNSAGEAPKALPPGVKP